MPFAVGNKFGKGRPSGAKNKIKPARIYYEVSCSRIGFKGSKRDFIEFCCKNPGRFYGIYSNFWAIEVRALGLEQLEFDFCPKK